MASNKGSINMSQLNEDVFEVNDSDDMGGAASSPPQRGGGHKSSSAQMSQVGRVMKDTFHHIENALEADVVGAVMEHGPIGRFLNLVGHRYRSLVSEFIGTFYLVLTVGLVVTQPKAPTAIMGPFAIGSMLTVLVFMGGHISGAHYNPAVTFGVYMSGRLKITTYKMFLYMTAQLLGGFFGAWMAKGLHQVSIEPKTSDVVVNDAGLVMETHDMQVLVAETLFTFILVMVVLNVATTESTSGNSFYGLGIGFTVASGAYAVGPMTGGVFNPAVGTGLTLIDAFYSGGTLRFLYLYWVGPCGGACLAAVLFRVLNPQEYDIGGKPLHEVAANVETEEEIKAVEEIVARGSSVRLNSDEM